jgi:transposase
VDPRERSIECPRCGFLVETQEGHIFKCPRCNLEMDRHKVASINIRRRYLEGERRKKHRMRGFPHSYEP